MSDDIAELVVERYAESKGIDKEEAKKKLMPVLAAKTESEFDRRVARLSTVIEMLDRLHEISKNSPEESQKQLSSMATALVGTALTDNSDPIEEAMRDVMKYVAKIKVIDKAFSDSEEKVSSKLLEEIQALKTKLENLEKEKEDKEKQMFLEKLESLSKKIEEIETALKTPVVVENTEKKEKTIDTLIEEYSRITEEARKWLERTGHKVELDRGLTREEVEKLLEEKKKEWIEKIEADELKNILQKKGYKIVGGPIPYDQVEKIVEEVKRRAYEEALDDKRIDAVAKIVEGSVERIIDMFRPAVSLWMERTLEARGGGQASRGLQESQQSSA
jgi:DNA repair exonuclease SbcCD ATPase subunit